MKEFIRREILARRNKQKGDVKLGKDCKIKKKFMELPEFKKARIILFYVSIRGEVKTDGMISECLNNNKRVLVPFANIETNQLLISEINNLDELEPGSFGIPEPKNPRKFPLDKVDLVITPGIAFDRKGNRVGYGTGFYDRFLKKLKKGIPFIGLAYGFQMVKEIPTDGMDVRVHKIVTEKEIIEC